MTGIASPLRLRSGLVLSNRIAKAAMTEALADDAGVPGRPLERVYERWSRGGAGLLVTGNVMIDARYLERVGNVVVDARADEGALARWVRAGTASGNAMIAQISHPGRQVNRFVAPEPLAPSAVAAVKVLGAFGRPRAMSEGEIDDAITRFARAAAICERAGFHGVQIHGAHGYLVSQFLSPITNRRTDRWGGSLANRARFLIETVRAVRRAVRGVVAVKLNSADFQRGGFTSEESIEVIAMLDREAIDLLEISGGSYESLALLGYDESGKRASTRAREAYFLEFAREARRATTVPLMLTGGVRSRAVMDDALASGAIDLVGLARPLCVEPALPRALLDGATDRAAPIAPGRFGVGVLEAAAESAWYGAQIARMGRGLDPDPRLGVRASTLAYVTHDAIGGPRRRWRGHARA